MKYIINYINPIKKTILYGFRVIIFFTIVLLAQQIITTQRTNAAYASNFNASNIIDDFVFYNSSSMSVNDIQNFLNSKVSSCDTNHNGYTGSTGTYYGPSWICLKDFYENPDSTYNVGFSYTDKNGAIQTDSRSYFNNNNYKYTALTPVYVNGDYKQGVDHLVATIQSVGGTRPSGAISAAQIIYNAAQQYGINPQVLIVLLQKEQGLITDTWPAAWQYQSATGYGCPDYKPCSSGYTGFSKQVFSAAWQFKAYQENPSNYSYIAGRNNTILYSPWCSTSTVVYIQNQATAGLYDYTPYVPNTAALAAGYGTGDGCSSYGNRNFYLYFNDWFGSTKAEDTLKSHPNGTLIDINGKVYLIQNDMLHHITSGAVFESYDYKWSDIKAATTGDKRLEISTPINFMKPGSLFIADSAGVYTSIQENSKWVKQLISYSSFLDLGYNWNQIHHINANDLPVDSSATILMSDLHPNGTLINSRGNVYVIDSGKKRYVSAFTFRSYDWRWSDIVPESTSDRLLPLGNNMTIKEGSVLSDGRNLYVMKISSDGTEIKLPIGPWECYANIYKYTTDDILYAAEKTSSIATGYLISC